MSFVKHAPLLSNELYTVKFLGWYSRAEEMFQWLKYLPGKYEDLSSNLRTGAKSDVAACIRDLIAATEKWETETGESSEAPGPAMASWTELRKI